MSYAGLVRPVIDRVHMGVRALALPRLLPLYERWGRDPGFETSLYAGLLARPMGAAAFAAASVYARKPIAPEIADTDADGTRTLTPLGREVALAVQEVVGAAAEELWSVGVPPNRVSVERLCELTGRLLEAGAATGGPAFGAMSPPYEPEGAGAALVLTSRLSALRHHRGDAHRAAWAAEGLSVEEVRELTGGPLWERIEADTNRRDEPVYAVLSEAERWEFASGLGSLPDGLRG
ncbi:hypothetical protein GCM10009551_032630 [Nocardiopsis tropica]|uniref:hypothetical protein n=1 Tax=Nocardiopsis tropica TaxID=109330 RepID=UPI0031E42D9C